MKTKFLSQLKAFFVAVGFIAPVSLIILFLWYPSTVIKVLPYLVVVSLITLLFLCSLFIIEKANRNLPLKTYAIAICYGLLVITVVYLMFTNQLHKTTGNVIISLLGLSGIINMSLLRKRIDVTQGEQL